MNALNAAMTVIGAGSYGTALAITLARNGHHVVLWGHDPKHIATLQHEPLTTPHFFLTFLSPTRCIWKAIWQPRWRPAAISSSSCRATFSARCCGRLNR